MNLQVTADKRILLIVNSLAEHGDRRLHRLYRFVESAGVETAKHFLNPYYDKIIVLRDQRATYAAFKSQLIMAASDLHTGAFDLFLQLHGEKKRLHFYDCWISTAQIAEDLRAHSGRNVLRLLYNLSCYGDTHSPDLLQAGFRVAIGSRLVNANAATEYPRFCRLWPGKGSGGREPITAAELIKKADRPLPRKVADLLARRYFREVDSKKYLRGNGNITIESMPD
mgnify:CR=1 FL=1